jgi:desulfoferrodoxin-like iron-binding protein
MPTQVGKRYFCEQCSSEMLVTRAGEGALSCCGQPMQLRGAPVPAPQPAEKSDA